MKNSNSLKISILSVLGLGVIGGGAYMFMNKTVSSKTTDLSTLKVQLIPSTDPARVQKAAHDLTPLLQKSLEKQKIKGFKKVEVSVSADYSAAEHGLKSNSIDVALITGQKDDKTFNTVVRATRQSVSNDPSKKDGSPATNDESKIVKDGQKKIEYLPETQNTAAFYRTGFWTKKGSKLDKIISAAVKKDPKNWTLDWDKVKDEVKIGYSSTKSEASYKKVELWMQKHFKGFKSIIESMDKSHAKKMNGASDQIKKFGTGQITLMANFMTVNIQEPIIKGIDKSVFEKQHLVGAGEPIDNDGLSARKSMSKENVEKVANAVKETIKTPKGKEAWKVYSYLGFVSEKK